MHQSDDPKVIPGERALQRRGFLVRMAALASVPLLEAVAMPMPEPEDTLDYWRNTLPPKTFEVLFKEGTEAAGSSPLNQEHRAGTFVCAACFLPLFLSEHKFESGTGWPSFTQALPKRTVAKTDMKLREPRTEYHCALCGGHQGHVFNDGPPPLGDRWCNNGVALRFVPDNEKLPELRNPAVA